MRKQSCHIKSLLERISDGDPDAYKQLYYLLFNSLYKFALSIIQSRQQAEEIVSDVFVKLWMVRQSLTGIKNPSVYLYTSVRNRALDYLRKDRSHTIVHLSPQDWEDSLIELKDPSDYCISSDLMKKINAAINQLPPQSKVIFRLVKEDGLSYKQVAKIMEISPLTVRNQLSIAVRKIGEILPGYIYEKSTVGKEKA
ncbi:MAG: RNA polymerase sigma-70 factor [Chitinophagaceae bacterium]|nr:RNA polymerase sigma-70 factor [Chitinophagaceae bacterium]MCW5926373.1 RNA polymerase sigma-70 factor [Chitinophagaceae bacterium]